MGEGLDEHHELERRGAYVPTGVLTEQRMRALADRWLAALAALADHARRPDAGGFTPSDLNLVELDQEDIESFEDELTSEWELS